MVALLSKEVNCPFPFSGPPPFPPSALPIAPFRVFSPKPQPMTCFHTLCLNRQPLLFKTPSFLLCTISNTSTRVTGGIPPTSSSYHQLQMLTAFVWLCGLASWQTSLPCPCLNHRVARCFPEPRSPLQSHATLGCLFPVLQYKQKLCRRTSAGGVLFPVPFGTKEIKPCVFGNSKKKSFPLRG